MEKLFKLILKLLNIALKLFVVIVIAFPFFWMISTAFKTIAETRIYPPTLLPDKWMFENFTYIFTVFPFWTFLKNSAIVAISIVVFQYFIIVPAAYAFARMKFKGSKILFGLVLVGLMLPQQISFVPLYIMFSKLNMMNSYLPQILPFLINCFGLFMLRQNFMQIPEEIIEAARLDNASEFKIMFKVILPMCKQAFVTVGLLQFITSWNNYFWPLIMTNGDTFRTLPIGVAMLKTQETGMMWNYIMAGNVLLVVPILIVYLFANKSIQKIFVYSGIK